MLNDKKYEDNANTELLFKRAFLLLEDGEFERADEFFEQVLNQDPENAKAYLGKLMAELRVCSQEDLANCEQPFDNSKNYKKAMRFGDNQIVEMLSCFINHINERNTNYIYDSAVSAMNAANTESAYKAAADKFRSISGFKDADNLAEQCFDKAEACRSELERQAEQRRIAEEKVAKKRKKIAAIVTPIVVACIAFLIVLTTVIIPNGKYNSAIEFYNAGKYDEAITAFQALNGYKDSKAQITKCETAIKDGKYNSAVELYNAGHQAEAIVAFKELNGYKESNKYLDFQIEKTESGYIVKGYTGKNTKIVIPNGVTSIGCFAFSHCSALTNIDIPASVTSIESLAFYDCSALTNIDIPANVTSIESLAFYGCSKLKGIKIPKSVTSIGYAGFSSLETITVAEGNTVYHSAGNCIIETASKTLIAGCKNSVIPIDGSVTSIGHRAFYDCGELTSIVIPASVTSIGDGAFYSCSALTNIEIPAGVTSIGDEAFSCSALTSIEIPASVTSIGEHAFFYCSSLTSINYNGTKAQWNAISKGSYWNFLTGDYTVYCTDGNISKANS